MIKLHADKISISRLIDIEAEFVCKTGEREAVEIKRNLVSPVAQFVPLPSELRYKYIVQNTEYRVQSR